LRSLATASPTRVVAIVDWARQSVGHHLPDGTDGDWFPDGDEVHPNPSGLVALGAMIGDAVTIQCRR